LQLYNIYLSRYRLQFAQDPKRFYNFVNYKRISSLLPHSVSYENTTANNDQAAADLYPEFFQTTYSVSSYSPRTSYPYSLQKSNFIPEPVITEDSVLCELNLIKPVSSPGPDGLPGWVLRYCAGSLYPLLQRLFILSVAFCSFPSVWKNSHIIPLHKSGPKSCVTTIGQFRKCLLHLSSLRTLLLHKLLVFVALLFHLTNMVL